MSDSISANVSGSAGVSDAWYTASGNEQDVVLSTRAMLMRNLANFPFPGRLLDRESEQIQSIVFDSFNYLHDADEYHSISVAQLDDVGAKIMKERGIIDYNAGKKAGIVLRADGKISCAVNTEDHIRLSAFGPGLVLEGTSDAVYSVDVELQKRIQFAASYDYGYLNSSVLFSGSGLCLASKVHLPALTFLERTAQVAEKYCGGEYPFIASYGPCGVQGISGKVLSGASLGAVYTVSMGSCAGGTEFDQIASMQCVMQNIVREEREARDECRKNHLSESANFAYRALALAQSSFFIPLKEAVELVNGVKFGVDLGIFGGVDDASLHALLFRIQEGHLEYVLQNGRFKFEKDVLSTEKKVERLRALIMQEILENVEK